MKNFIPILLLCPATLLFSCGTTSYTSSGYENDDVYYVPGDADRPQYSEYSTEGDDRTEDYYSDDDQQDDYYSEDNQGYDQRGSGNTYNNYNYYRYQQSPFARHGFYDPVYSSAWYNPPGPTFGPHFGWNSYYGWNVGFSWNYGWSSWYHRPIWGPHYNPYTPYWNPYDPFFAGTYCSPYYSGVYGYGNYNDYLGRGATGSHYGHRTPITSNSDLNSNYSGGTIYAVRKSADVAERSPRTSGNVPTVKPQRTPDMSTREPGFQRDPQPGSIAEQRLPSRGNNVQEQREERTRGDRTDYYQWRPSEDDVQRRPSRDTDRNPATTQPERERQDYRQPDRQQDRQRQPEYRQPDRQPDPQRQPQTRPERTPDRQQQPDYRERNNGRSNNSGLLDLLFDGGNDDNRSRGTRSRPSTRSRSNDRPSYNPPSNSRGRVSPNRSSGSSPSRGGSSGGSRSRSRGGGR